MKQTVRVTISDQSQVAEARRCTVQLAASQGFDETRTAEAAIVGTELATNLIKHGGGGELLLRSITQGNEQGVELITLDRGRGIANIDECLRDGYSTAGSPGTGLGAIARLSSTFEIFSVPGEGTALMARLWARQTQHPPGSDLHVEGISCPKPGQTDCGDGWSTRRMMNGTAVMVVDGLGHGLAAADASRVAVETLAQEPESSPAMLLEAIHAAMRSTRGGVAAIAWIDTREHVIRFAGIGNIHATIFGPERRQSLVSHNGTMGHQIRKIQEFTYEWPAGSTLVMSSDGLGTQYNLDSYPGLGRYHPSLIAGVLYRDFTRGSDDATVIVAREAANGS